MTDSTLTKTPAVEAPKQIPALPTVLGDCAIRLSHATSYEPPLYLFPQLLPQVPQGTAPIMVWDSVAGAVDVASSYWHMADASSLLPSSAQHQRAASKKTSATGSSSGSPAKKSAVTTLASLLSSNKLLPLGLHPTVLENGAFSAASMVQELAALQTRAELSDEEAAVLMSNHFVNLLAWKKLREINNPAPCLLPASQPSSKDAAVSEPEPEKAGGKKAHARKRGRDEAEETTQVSEASSAQTTTDVLAALEASPDPWTDVVNDPQMAGTFIAGQETGVEKRVDLLRTLSALYRRPWRALRSSGAQTDLVVPPGTVNTTSPYAHHEHVAGAQLRPDEDLGWVATAPCMQLCEARAGAQSTHGEDNANDNDDTDAHSPPFTLSIGAATTGASQSRDTIGLTAATTYVGKAAGPLRTASMGSVEIDVGLAQYTSRPELLSALHFALMLRPVYGAVVPAGTATDGAPSPNQGTADDGADGHGDAERAGSSNVSGSLIHTKSPTSYKLLLVNYGQNGVRVVGRRWVLGDVLELRDGDELRAAADSIAIKITGAQSASSATTTTAEAVKDDPGLTPVKREHTEE